MADRRDRLWRFGRLPGGPGRLLAACHAHPGHDRRCHRQPGEPGDSPGDILVFDQPLLDTERQTIGNNSGSCIRTRSGHSLQCQWTLTLAEGTIQVAGREFDRGTSAISITGGTGSYAGISGEMLSVNNEDGTFTQTLHYHLGVK